jgi:hypothetical protein
VVFLLGVFVGALLVCLPLVVIVLSARSDPEGLQIVDLAEMEIRAIKRDTVKRMFETVDVGRFSGQRFRSGMSSNYEES